MAEARGAVGVAVGLVALVAAGCPVGPLPRGFASACYADENGAGFETRLDVVHTGVRRVPAAESAGIPDALFECGEAAVVGEFVDVDGLRFWVAADVFFGEASLVPRRVFDDIDAASDDVTVAVAFDRFFPAFSSRIVVSDGPRVHFALESDVDAPADAGGLGVADGGQGDERRTYCGVERPIAVALTHDDGAASVAFGERVDVVVDGHGVRVVNFGSVAYGQADPNCFDVPSNESRFGWVAFDDPR
jgi:hypothetical protein